MPSRFKSDSNVARLASWALPMRRALLQGQQEAPENLFREEKPCSRVLLQQRPTAVCPVPVPARHYVQRALAWRILVGRSLASLRRHTSKTGVLDAEVHRSAGREEIEALGGTGGDGCTGEHRRTYDSCCPLPGGCHWIGRRRSWVQGFPTRLTLHGATSE